MTSIATKISAVTTPAQPQKTSQNSRSGRWFLVALGLIVAIIGGIFVSVMARSFLRAREMRQWPEVSCVILVSEIEEKRHDPFSAIEFRQKLRYAYEWQGQSFTGERLTLRENPWSSKRVLAEKRTAAYREGMVTSCRVNPLTPEIAVLKPDSLAPGYSIWFPSLFIIGGLGICVQALRKY